jgi:hypothetical protein
MDDGKDRLDVVGREGRAVNEGFRCSPLPALCPARLPARRLSVTMGN